MVYPCITHSDRLSVGKIGASILETLGHRKWIDTLEEEYVEKAVALASDPQKYTTFVRTLYRKVWLSYIDAPIKEK